MSILGSWYKRHKRDSFLGDLKEYQVKSSRVLGIDDFYVPAFDVSARSTIESGIPNLQSLELMFAKYSRGMLNEASKLVAVDLGANIGHYSLFFSRFYSKVLAIEAHPLTFRLLTLNTETLSNITCFNFAVSDSSNGNAVIKEFRRLQSTRASIEFGNQKNIPIRSFEVPKKTLDNFFEDSLERVGLIKVDVEGHDLQALIGAAKTIKKFSPVIIFEYNLKNPLLLQTLNDFGYNKFFAPSTEILPRFANKQEVLNWLLSRPTPIKDFRKLYSKPGLFEFDAAGLPLSELVLTFPSRD